MGKFSVPPLRLFPTLLLAFKYTEPVETKSSEEDGEHNHELKPKKKALLKCSG